MGAVTLWLWDSANSIWRKALCDANGKLQISDADPFEVAQGTPENLKHVPHGYYPTGGTYHPFQVDSAGKLLITLSNLAHLNDIDDVNVPAPTDNYLLYWDEAAGKWQAKAIPSGAWADITGKPTSPSLEEMATEHEADGTHGDITPTSCTLIDAHKDLTTGIHGVGARYIAETTVENVDLAAHLARHEFGGGDVLSIPKVLAQSIGFGCDWQTSDAWTAAHSGTGGVTYALMGTELFTGATQNSIGKIYAGNPFYPWGVSAGFYWKLLVGGDGFTNCEAWMALVQGTTPAPTTKHIGWFIEDGEIWASNANGTTQTKTDTGISIATAWSGAALFWENVGGAVKFYVNGVLKATHTTNIPNDYNYRPICYIKNDGVAANRYVRISYIAFYGNMI